MENADLSIWGREEFETIKFIPTPLVISQPSLKDFLVTETEYADFDCIGTVRQRVEVGQKFRLAEMAPEGFEEAIWTVMQCVPQEASTKIVAKPDVEELAEIEQQAFQENRIIAHRHLFRFLLGA